MSDDPAKDRLNRPFHVRTISGTLLETFDVEAQAAAAAKVANGTWSSPPTVRSATRGSPCGGYRPDGKPVTDT